MILGGDVVVGDLGLEAVPVAARGGLDGEDDVTHVRGRRRR